MCAVWGAAVVRLSGEGAEKTGKHGEDFFDEEIVKLEGENNQQTDGRNFGELLRRTE